MLELELVTFADSAIGADLSPQVESLIARAGLLRQQPQQALALLKQAQAAAPRHPAPLIALYRFYFYGHQLLQARAVGEDALAVARTALGPNFGDDPPPAQATRHDAAVRFYLFSLKALAYLNMRLGAMEEAYTQLKELRRLDPNDHVGGAVLLHVLMRHQNGDTHDTYDIYDAMSSYPAHGWGSVVI